MTRLEADARLVDEVVRKRWRSALGVAAITVPLAGGILIVEYRLALLAVILLALPAIAAAEGIRLRRQVGPDGRIDLKLGAGGAVARVHRSLGAPEEAVLPYVGMVARVMPDLVVVAVGTRAWLVPATPADATLAGHELAAHGVTVHRERGGVVPIGALLTGALLSKVLKVVAGVCVTAAFANIGLAALHRGGSYVLGGALMGGALLLLTLAAIIDALVSWHGS